jgi:hypothetical protein
MFVVFVFISDVLRPKCHRNFITTFPCPHRVLRVGTLSDGGKWVCGLDRVAKQDKCVMYSFGLFRFRFSSRLSFPHTLPFPPPHNLTSNFPFFTGINGELRHR